VAQKQLLLDRFRGPGSGDDDPDAGNEHLVLEKLRRGDERAWTKFFKEYEGRIITMCVAMTRDQGVAEEICADTFVRVVSSIDEFREGSSIKTWIYTIARNLCLTHLARAKQTVALDDEMAEVLPDRSPGAEQTVADQEVDTVLQEAIGELDPSLREALLLRVTGDLSYAEIAQTTGVPVATVATRVHRAREQLRRRLARVL
jgi:RNA polymerase sigma-70 factor, ECF subfamily